MLILGIGVSYTTVRFESRNSEKWRIFLQKVSRRSIAANANSPKRSG